MIPPFTEFSMFYMNLFLQLFEILFLSSFFSVPKDMYGLSVPKNRNALGKVLRGLPSMVLNPTMGIPRTIPRTIRVILKKKQTSTQQ